ncbi:hypothetical protein [Intestinibacter sp.]|uniref:hypothetical protein n=1 Tax=Intestinibacter sp. TaxID=1965304 RepID=UPI00267206E8|nr:hypothetical protein [Intestinibacter sp.]
MIDRELNEIKNKYNQVLERFKKAEAFLEDESIPLDERMKYIGEEEDIHKPKKLFNQVVRSMSLLIKEYETHTGFGMTTHEVFNGFDI